jgi:hypothetical protein
VHGQPAFIDPGERPLGQVSHRSPPGKPVRHPGGQVAEHATRSVEEHVLPKSSSGMENVAGMPNCRSASACTSFEPRHGETPQAGTSL